MENEEELKLKLFGSGTTYSDDYKKYKPDHEPRHRWPLNINEPLEPKVEPVQFECHESFSKLKDYVPFNVYWKSRNHYEVVNLNELKAKQDEGKSEAIRSRPRLLFPTAISLDDIPSMDMREMIVSQIYKSQTRYASEHGVPFTPVDITSDTHVLDFHDKKEKDKLLPVPDNWLKVKETWDKNQIRAIVDPNVKFWQNKDPPVICGACVNRLADVVPDKVKTEIHDLMVTDQLRMPHDKLMPGHCGYAPHLALNVQLKRKDYPLSHPMLTTNQVDEKLRENVPWDQVNLM